MSIICPYCSCPAALVPSSVIYGDGKPNYGMFWFCAKDDAYVGTHKNSKDHKPLGRLANRELRRWKQNAHNMFDPLWRSGKMSRSVAYQHLAFIMGMTTEEAHIGKFDVEQCKRLCDLMRAKINE